MFASTAASLLLLLGSLSATVAQNDSVCNTVPYADLLSLAQLPDAIAFCQNDFPVGPVATVTSSTALDLVTVTSVVGTTTTVVNGTFGNTTTSTSIVATATDSELSNVTDTSTVYSIAATTTVPYSAPPSRRDVEARGIVTSVPSDLSAIFSAFIIADLDLISTVCSCIEPPVTSTVNVTVPASTTVVSVTDVVVATATGTATVLIPGTTTSYSNATTTTIATVTVASTVTDTCPSATPDVCASGCVDLANDNANCGACGTACGTGFYCAAGVCEQPSRCNTPTDGAYRCNVASSSDTCVCYETTDGLGYCDDVSGSNDYCQNYERCTTSLDCPSDSVCLDSNSTTCGYGICGKACGSPATGTLGLIPRGQSLGSMKLLALP